MYSQISTLISALEKCGALRHASVRSAIQEFAACIGDEDYRTHMVGEMAVSLAEAGQFREADCLAATLAGLEKSTFLIKIAEIEMQAGEDELAASTYDGARKAALERRFPTQRSQAIAAIAVSVERFGKWETSASLWQMAVGLAKEGQVRGGTDGPEAAGVLLDAAEAFRRNGDREQAERIAKSILIEELRHRALGALGPD